MTTNRPKMNKSELAAFLKVSRTTLYAHLRREGAPTPDAKGKYDALAVSQFIMGRRERDLRGGGSSELTRERILKLRCERRRLEMELCERAGKLVCLADVVGVVEDKCRALRTVLLGLPNRVAPMVQGKSTPEIATILRDEITATLTGFSDDLAAEAAKLGKGKESGDTAGERNEDENAIVPTVRDGEA